MSRDVDPEREASPAPREDAAPAPPAPGAPGAGPERGLGWMFASIGAPAILILGAFFVATRLRHQAPPPAPDAGASPRTALGLAGLPPPSCSAGATAEIMAGREALRAASGAAALAKLRAALTLDPDCAEAHLRVALLTASEAPAEARASSARARALDARLTARDRELLGAIEPSLAAPPDVDETRKRLRKLVETRSRDAELLVLAAAHAKDDVPFALQQSQLATRIDPGYGEAWRVLAVSSGRAGEMTSADHALDRCFEVAPRSVDCLRTRLLVHQRMGRCEAMEEGAREAVGRELGDGWPRTLLANALASRGAPRALVLQALEPRWAALGAEGDWVAHEERARLAALYGDFVGAREALAALGRAIEARRELAAHAGYVTIGLDLFEEAGDAAGAEKLATAEVEKLARWSRGPSDLRATLDFEPRLAALLPARKDEILAPWRASLRGADIDDEALWALGDVLLATNAKDAAEALTRMPKLTLRQAPSAFPSVDYVVGRAELAARRAPAALPRLRAAASRCDALDRPFEHVRAQERLGAAFEGVGADLEACKAYREVMLRWGSAARSVKTAPPTVVRASERIRALRCPVE